MTDSETPTTEHEAIPAEAAAPAPDTSDDALETELRAIYDKSMGEGEAPAEDAETAPEPDSKSPDTQKSGDGEPSEAIAKPDSWPGQMGDAWSSLPRDVQEYVAQREREAHAQISRLGTVASRAEPLLGVVKDYRHVIPKGMTEDVAVRNLLAAQALLTQDPVTGLEAIAKQFGVDLRQYAHDSDPERTALRHEVAAYRAQREQNQAKESHQAEETVNTVIDTWSADKPHYDTVLGDLVAIVPTLDKAGKTHEQVLDEAYERACWANPEVRAQIQADEAAKRDKETRKTRHGEEAARNRRSNAGRTASFAPMRGKTIDMDSDEDMMALYSAATAD
jgi:hypothetical protein